MVISYKIYLREIITHKIILRILIIKKQLKKYKLQKSMNMYVLHLVIRLPQLDNFNYKLKRDSYTTEYVGTNYFLC